MLRFFSRFQADFQLKSGWIEPLLVGGYAPFSPPILTSTEYSTADQHIFTKAGNSINDNWQTGWADTHT